MMYFDASNPYHRQRMHYESQRQLSLPELIGRGSLDAATGAVLWTLLEHRASYIIAGPTDPTPGVGKTTTLNSLLPFYPRGTGLVYTLGMYEDFDFVDQVTPQETTVLANEVSDHLPIYMWGGHARTFLRLPEKGFTIATTCHADRLPDVMSILQQDLRLQDDEIRQIRFIVNIGLVGRTWPQRRRWLTTHFILPPGTGPDAPMVISRWREKTDAFTAPKPEVVAAMAAWAGVTEEAFQTEVATRAAFLADLAAQNADHRDTILALEALRTEE
jgi:hypothetical protein